MAHNPRTRTAPRILSEDSPYTPRATPIRTSSVSTRGVRSAPTAPDEIHTPVVQSTNLPAHYALPPTIPSPFTGTLDASLDAILAFNHYHGQHMGMQSVLNTLLRPVETSTNWPLLLRAVYVHDANGRGLLEEVLFLVTRTLLPEQIAQNRSSMARLYGRKKHLAIRLIVRYDMLREWREGVAVASVPPLSPQQQTGIRNHNGDVDVQPPAYQRPTLLPNIMSALIAAPPGGWTTHAVRERMKHHVIDLDAYLLLSDEKVASWSDQTLLIMASQIILQWQWLQQNNLILEEMEVNGYEELEVKADECEWIVDDVKRLRSKGDKVEKEGSI
jgi:hypothetical protein